jgi:predicted dehydrogenase
MTNINRREFLRNAKKTGLGLAAGLTILGDARSVRAAPANDRLVMALVGFGRGTTVARGFAARGDCAFAYVADVNRRRFFERQWIAEVQGGRQPKCLQDFRKALDDPSVDAMLIATSDHWHALATVWACRAGKDVYVEKPCSHNAWEGQQMVAAARKHQRIVQVGTQNRSAPYIIQAKQYLQEGRLGEVHRCCVYNQELVDHDVTLGKGGDPPKDLDWEMFTGPAPLRPYCPTLHNQGKYELWDYSGGEIVRNGVHQLDLARWICDVDYPQTVYSVGGKLASGGDGEVPDTQLVVYQFDRLVMTMEYSGYTPYMLDSDAGIRDADVFPHWPQNGTRIELYGTEGLMVVGRMGGGWQVFDRTKNRRPVVKQQAFGRFCDTAHQANFVECVRSRELPNADILESHRSTLLSHYGNISYRTGGRKLRIDPQTEQIIDNDEAMQLFKRQYRRPWVLEDKV